MDSPRADGSTTARTRAPARAAQRRRRVMLVSATASSERRADALAGVRPTPEYLVLERDHGLEILDWSAVPGAPTQRSASASLRHVTAALLRARDARALLSDGEHLGLPLAQALALWPRRPGHVVIAHHLTTPAKRRLLALPGLTGAVDSFVVHSQAQVDTLVSDVGLSPDQVRLVHYGVDTDFWSGRGEADEEPLVVSSGREHRDYATLAAAMRGLDARAFIADGSSHSPGAHRRTPEDWPANIERAALSPERMRALYERAAVVVVPVVPTDFPAGITVVVEAMAMGKAVIVSATAGFRGAVADEGALVRVPPEDPAALREAIVGLLADPAERRSLGLRAQQVARDHHDVTHLSAELDRLLDEAGDRHG